MDDIKTRESLDATLAASGYVHPTSNNPKKSSYRSYGDTGYTTKKQTTTYATFDTTKTDLEVCPDCSQKALYKCGCVKGDMLCKNGHIWHLSEEGVIILGDPHKND